MPGILLDTLNGQRGAGVPLWLMRQAGRYLPEYRALRAEKGGFLELAYDSEAAAEVTIQPIRRFGFDGAILFSDILVIPHAMGQDLWFEAGEGPRLAPPLIDAAWAALEAMPQRLDPVYGTVRRCRELLGPETTMLGFAGSPWTVATYMVAGQGSKDHHEARALAYRDPVAFGDLIEAIERATVDYLIGQIDAGVEAVQLFDSWAGSLAPDQYARWVIAPNARLAAALHQARPGIPVMGFPKGSGEKLAAYARETGVDAVGIDETLDPAWVAANLAPDLPVQGNLDPLLLLAGGQALVERTELILRAFADRPHVFNLGHGIGQFTPIANVEQLVATVRAWQG